MVPNEFATGSYASTAVLALPPAINTPPPLSAIAAWPVLETPIEFDVAAVVPLGGVPAVNVNSSAVADPPPAIRTLPLERSVAVAEVRATCITVVDKAVKPLMPLLAVS